MQVVFLVGKIQRKQFFQISYVFRTNNLDGGEFFLVLLVIYDKVCVDVGLEKYRLIIYERGLNSRFRGFT